MATVVGMREDATSHVGEAWIIREAPIQGMGIRDELAQVSRSPTFPHGSISQDHVDATTFSLFSIPSFDHPFM